VQSIVPEPDCNEKSVSEARVRNGMKSRAELRQDHPPFIFQKKITNNYLPTQSLFFRLSKLALLIPDTKLRKFAKKNKENLK